MLAWAFCDRPEANSRHTIQSELVHGSEQGVATIRDMKRPDSLPTLVAISLSAAMPVPCLGRCTEINLLLYRQVVILLQGYAETHAGDVHSEQPQHVQTCL